LAQDVRKHTVALYSPKQFWVASVYNDSFDGPNSLELLGLKVKPLMNKFIARIERPIRGPWTFPTNLGSILAFVTATLNGNFQTTSPSASGMENDSTSDHSQLSGRSLSLFQRFVRSAACAGMAFAALLHPTPMRATTVYLRTPNTNYCNVTAATNATPIHVTVDNAAGCGLSNGATIVISDVEGNTAANVNPTGATQLCRTVANLSGNSFDLHDCAGNNVAGNGTFSGSLGRLGRATAYTLKSGPIVWMDGTGGTLMTAMTNKGSTGRANAANPPFAALTNVVTSYESSYGSSWGADVSRGSGWNMTGTQDAALYWLSTGDSKALAAAKWGVDNIDQWGGSLACDESQNQCGNGTNQLNYTALNGPALLNAYSILRGQLSQSEVSTVDNYILNDLPYTQGGIDTTAHTKVPFTGGNGTITFTGGSTAVTGSGTSFTTQVSPGQILVLGTNAGSFSTYGKVVSVKDNTHLTIAYPAGGTTSNSAYWVASGSSPSYYGMVWYEKHLNASLLCGGSKCSANYPTQGGVYPTSGNYNLAITLVTNWIHAGLATCADDIRGCLLLEQSYEWWYDLTYPWSLSTWTGYTEAGYNYSPDRVLWMNAAITWAIKASLVSGPDLTGGNWLKHSAAWWYMNDSPNTGGSGTVNGYGELSGPQYWDLLHMQALPLYLYLYSSTAEGSYANYWLRNYSGYWTTGTIQGSGGAWIPLYYIFTDPAQTATDPAGKQTAYAFNQTDQAACTSVFGTANCQPANAAYNYFVSKSGFTAADTGLYVDSLSNQYAGDHSGYDLGSEFAIRRNVLLMAGDNNSGAPCCGPGYGSGNGAYGGNGYLELGGSDSRINNGSWAINYLARSTDGTTESAVSKFAYILEDSTKAFASSANASRVQRHFAHLKKSGGQDYIVEYNDIALTAPIAGASGASIRAYYDLALNGCGSPSSSSCITASLSSGTFHNKQSNAVLNTAVLSTSGPISISTANSSNTDGSYSGGKGYAWQYWVCPGSGSCNTSATSGEWLAIYQPSTTTSTIMPTLSQPAATNFRVVQIADSASPKVAAFATGGNTYTSVSFTTTHAGTAQYLIAGLTAGSYAVTVNGGAITGSPFTVVNGDNTLYFEGTSGAYSVSQSGGGGGSGNGGGSGAQAPAITSFTAKPAAIAPGATATLSWTVTGNPTPSLSINNGVGTVTGSSITVSPKATTTYTLTATNSSGNTSANTAVTVTTDTQAPSQPTNLTPTAASISQINLTWTASTDNVGITGYRVERCSGAGCTTFAQIGTPAATAYSDTGLTANTLYSYRVRATDAAGNLSAYSTVGTATTSAQAQTISYVQMNYTTPQTAQSSVSVAFPGAQTAGNLNVVAIGWSDSSHSISAITDKAGNTYTRAIGPNVVSGFSSQSIYYAKSIASAAAGANTVTVTFSGAVPYPDIRVVEYSGADPTNPLDVTAGSTGNSPGSSSGALTTTNSAELLFAANYVQTGTSGSGSGFTKRMITQPDSDIVEDSILTAKGSYTGTAPLSQSGWWVMQMAAFRAASGTVTPPTQPANLKATAASGSQINLSWTASNSSIGIAHYNVQHCQGSGCSSFTPVATPTGTTYSDTGLTLGTSYSYRVQAVDTAGNVSAFSTVASATTTTQSDTQPPTVPTNLTATPVAPTQINLSWTASVDNVGVAGYVIYRNGAKVVAITATTYSDASLTPATTYSYIVVAYDAAGNVSAQSTPATTTTPGGGPTIGGCPIFPSNNIWNTPIANLPVDSNSSAYINTIGSSTPLHPDFSSSGGGIPINVAPPNTPAVAVSFSSDEDDPGPYPIPANALVEQGSDAHIIVVDQGNCKLYETWASAKQANGTWTAGSGAVFDLNSNILRPSGWTTADAAGLPILPGLIKYSEVMAGHINHAIRMTAPQTRNQFIWPARHQASSLSGTQYPPMGQHFRLKASFSVSGYSAEVQVILNALKTYGAILADNGSSWYLQGEANANWNDSDIHTLSQIVGSNMEAVNTSSLEVEQNSAAVAGSPLALAGIYLDQREVVTNAKVNAEAILTAPAPAGGATVAITSSNSGVLSAPASVTIPANSVSAPVPVTIHSITQTTPAVLSSTYNSATNLSPVLLVDGTNGTAAPRLSALNVLPVSVAGGNSALGTVTLTSAAPTGGITITLSSSNTAAANVPATVTVAAGSTTAQFIIRTAAQTSNTTVGIQATLNGESLTFSLAVTSK
jgi:chitodextrinase